VGRSVENRLPTRDEERSEQKKQCEGRHGSSLAGTARDILREARLPGSRRERKRVSGGQGARVASKRGRICVLGSGARSSSKSGKFDPDKIAETFSGTVGAETGGRKRRERGKKSSRPR